ncbi:unnamed protein product [Mytilus edulis]|uniref:PiggyBac transposable element-derived protein domain-containing protein n=1 Tax=Mytilus edulis TaxID=6550 RepID=A0A8S3RNY0_MYTED|nr:unnamed protein product [Mytilus edulis]
MASDVDQDTGDHQCILKLFVKSTDHTSEDKSDSKVKALYESLIEKREYFTKHIGTALAKDGITLTNSHIKCNENSFIQFHWFLDKGLDRRKLNLFITNGQFEKILTSYIDGLDIQSNISGSEGQKMNLDVSIQCDNSEKSKKITASSNSPTETDIQKVLTEQLSPVKVQSEIQVQKAQAVRDASWDAESSCENLEKEHTRNELKKETTVSETKFDSKMSNEQDLQRKNVRVYLDIKSKNVYSVEMEFPNKKRSLLKNKDTCTNIWQIDCSVSKNVHDSFIFHIEVSYNNNRLFTPFFRKQLFASFSDYSKSPYIFVGLTTSGKSLEIDAMCDFSVDIINDATFNLRNALLQMEAMANQQNADIQTQSIQHNHDNSGSVLCIDKFLSNKNEKSLGESVLKKMEISAKSLMAFCYFLFVIKAENMNLKDLSAILDTRKANVIVDACKRTKKDEIPQNCIVPILTIVKNICKLANRTESSALFVIDVVHKLANLRFLSKLIDEYQPLYLPTKQFKWEDMLHRMYAENLPLLIKIVQNLQREMLIEFLLVLYQKGIKNNDNIHYFEHILDCRNCAAVGRFGQSQELHHVLSIWESTAKVHVIRSKKFVTECEQAILKSISDVSNVKRDNLDLLFKVLVDNILFLSQTMQCNLIENLSELKTTETAKYFELLIQLLNSDKIPVSGEEHFHLIEQWFRRSGLHRKPESKNERNSSKLVSQAYLRLSQVLQTKYVRKHKNINGFLENAVFDVIKEFKFKAFAKVLHEDVNPDVRDIFVVHIRKLLQDRCFESDANAIILDICENDILNIVCTFPDIAIKDSDGDITDIVTSGDEDSDDADVEMPDNAARQPNPWFSVVDKETYANQCQTTENPTRHARSNEWSPVSYAEMRAFIGLVLAMGIVKKTSIESYWEASGISETPNFRDVMSRNRFQAILRYLHCSDNTTAVPRGQPGYDPLHKINPVVEFFNEVFELNYRLSQNIVVDERIVGFKGRHVLKQYISNKKAHRWGAKLFVLAESRTGYTHQINVYKGKRNTERHPNGQGYKSVMDLVRPHFGKNHHVTMDNWFSSPKLMNDLRNRGTYATGTVITRRKGLPASFKTARLPKGSVVVKSTRDLNMAILYVDLRNVTFLTTSENERTVRKVNSKGRVVSAPSVVHKYNQTMGGVDLGDQLLLKFEPQFKGVKLWRKILFNLLTTATVNAYICYRNYFLVQRKLDHVKFQNAVVRGLIGDFRGGNRRRGRRPDNIPIANAIRIHFLDVIPDGKRRKCVKCSGYNKYRKSRISTWCSVCGVGLCVGRCFREFHSYGQEE